MVSITKGRNILTLINVFTVAPENQFRLVELLVEATEKTMKNVPGFIPASVHRSADGVRVVNYAQWRSREDFAAMLKNPLAGEHLAAIREIATFDAHTYEVMESIAAA